MDYNDGCCYCSNLWDPRIPGGEDTTDVAAGFRTPVDTAGCAAGRGRSVAGGSGGGIAGGTGGGIAGGTGGGVAVGSADPLADFGCDESIDAPVREETSDAATILHTCRNFLAHCPYQWLWW